MAALVVATRRRGSTCRRVIRANPTCWWSTTVPRSRVQAADGRLRLPRLVRPA